MAEAKPRVKNDYKVTRADAAGLGDLIGAVNRTLADEEHIASRIAIFRQGINLTDRLGLKGGRGWFAPLVHDLLAQGVSVVVNDIGLTTPVCAVVERVTGIPADWVFQQNLYITPAEVQGFVPHCDPHIVCVAHLFGRKEWIIYDKALDNPLILDGGKEVLVADAKETLREKVRFTVEAGDMFVIPRGHFHAARALTGGAAHMAIGCAGIRPVDYLWAIAGAAMERSELRGDYTPDDALRAARDYLGSVKPAPLALPRNPVATVAPATAAQALIFEEALVALQGA